MAAVSPIVVNAAESCARAARSPGTAVNTSRKPAAASASLPLREQRVRQIVPGVGIVRLNPQRVAELLDGFVYPALGLQRGAVVVQRLRLLRRQAQGLAAGT